MMYVEKAFYEVINGTKTLKTLLEYDAANGEVKLQKGTIAILKNYKSNCNIGKKDSLKGRDIIRIPLIKGNLDLPLDELEHFATILYSLAQHFKEDSETEEA